MVYLPTFGSFLLVNERKYIECLGFYWFDFCSLWADELGPAPSNPLGYTNTNNTILNNGTSVFLVKEDKRVLRRIQIIN